jgi:serine/threonine protein kinase
MKAPARAASAIERSLVIDARSASFQRAFEAIRARWDAGEPIDALAALASYPDLADDKQFVLEVAYEEYCRRSQAGDPLPQGDFCRRFPAYRASLARLIDIHHLIAEKPELLLPDDVWPAVGETYLGFELLRELGRGAFSCVYLARELDAGNRPVALKVSNGSYDEALTQGKLRHPNIVWILHPQQDPETLQTVISMPFEGQVTLADLLDRLPRSRAVDAAAISELVAAREATDVPELTETAARAKPLERAASFDETVLALGIQLCDALAYAHGKQVFHHDLKPSNILVTPNLQALLFDFNLSVDAEVAGRRQGGTLPYMAPEQLETVVLARPGGSRPGAQADIYALGVVLYELLTGCLPLDPGPQTIPVRQAAAALLDLQRRGAPRVACEGRAVDEELAAIVSGCLSFDPAARPQSAEALGTLLRRRLASLQRSKRLRQRLRQLVAAVVVLSVTSGLGLGLFAVVRPSLEDRELAAGQSALTQGQFHDAVAHFDLALASEPASLAALRGRARAYTKLGEFSSAVADYDAMLKVWPAAGSDVFAGKGYCLAKAGDLKAAIACFNEANQRGMPSAAIFNDLGYCLQRSHSFEDARDAFDRAIELDSKLQPAYCNRIALILSTRDVIEPSELEMAISDFRRARDLGPQSGELDGFGALLYGEAAQRDENQVGQMLSCLASAKAKGLSIDWLVRYKSIAPFANRADVRAILTKSTISAGEITCERLVELP